jgi:hypothetical protein
VLDQVRHQARDFGQPHVGQRYTRPEAGDRGAQQIDKWVVWQPAFRRVTRPDKYGPAWRRSQLARWLPVSQPQQLFDQPRFPDALFAVDLDQSTAPGCRLFYRCQ